jgi:Fe-Mn family superoxide dismutase
MSARAAMFRSPHCLEAVMPIILPKLPYPLNALEPSISGHTMQEHYGNHHRTYIEKTNSLLKDTGMADWPLDEIVKATANGGTKTPLYNNAAQAWNHGFYWNSMQPRGGGMPRGALVDKINADFGSFEKFSEAFKESAVNHFGSGWTWLVVDRGKLMIVSTHDADTPIAFDQMPLITTDLWEHAYYLDYQHRRPDYVTAFLNRLVNWEFAERNFEHAMGRQAAA